MRTYSRIRKYRSDDNQHIAKRRRISSDEPQCTLSDSSSPTGATSPSSPQSLPALFSDPTPAEQSPSSSPPIRSVASRTRRPAFAFLRKGAAKPLSHGDGNVQTQKPPAKDHAKPKQKLVQMQLDLGRQLHKTCRTCGMEFIPSSTEDVSLHKKFHAMNVGGVDLGKSVGANRIWSGDQGAYVIAVDAKSSLVAKRRVEKVLQVVQTELGAVEIPSEKLWEEIYAEDANKETDAKDKKRYDRYKAFLFVQGSKCVGFCLAERISSAFEVIQHSSNQQGSHDLVDANESSSVLTKVDPSRVIMGISRIWTSSSHRKKKIASTLLDCSRKNFLYGIEIPKDMVAFSQPTESGGKLARHWFGKTHGWKAYSDCGPLPHSRPKRNDE